MKKWISALLLVSLLASLMLPVGAASTSFTDIKNATTQQQAAVLQMMGVMEGTGGSNFSPDKTLSRAEFCKMTVLIMGKGEEEPLYRTRTIFKDVLSNHWARGYINLAVSTAIGADDKDNPGVKLIRGNADGTFAPNRAITYAESVTILMRLLGYADADAGMIWPKGYLDLAAKVGLTKGLSLTQGQALTRAQAAQLFVTMLKTPQKGGNAFYNTLGAAKSDMVLLSGNVAADDGTLGALLASDEVIYKTVSGVVPPSLVGSRGTLVTNTAGKAIVFIPVGEQKSITVSAAQAAWIVDENNKKHTIPTEAPAYTATKAGSYSKMWTDLHGGMRVNLFYSAAGKVEGVYIGGGQADAAMIAKQSSSGNPFEALLGGASGYDVYRDGTKATLADIALHDVGTYDPTMRVLSVSSAKLTGTYENVWPNEQSPSKITIMGATLKVLPMAMEELANYKIGQSITVLLTADQQVAGVITTAAGNDGNVGVLDTYDGSKAEVTLLNGIKVTGETSTNVAVGELVRVTAGGVKKIFVSTLSTSGVSGSFDVDNRKLGSLELTGSCRFYEKVGASKMQAIALSDLARRSVPSSAIKYAHQNTAGKIDVIVFNNATGDLYEYGFLRNGAPESGGSGEMSFTNNTIEVRNQALPDGGKALVSNIAIKKDQPGGMVAVSGETKAAGVISLQEEKGIKRSAFSTTGEETFVTLKTQVMRVSDKVQCYNAVTKTWFADLADARAFSDELTVYYDKSVSDGGKVRLVVAN